MISKVASAVFGFSLIASFGFLLLTTIALSFSQPVVASAENLDIGGLQTVGQAGSNDTGDICGGSGRYFLGIPSWDRGLGDCEQISGEEILSGEKITIIVNNIIAILTHLAAFVAVGFVIYGGVKFILSQGNSDQAAEARKTIINAGIGIVIVIMARVITEVIHNNITGG